MKVLNKKLQDKGFAIHVSDESPFMQRYFMTRGNEILAHMKFCSYLGEYYDFEELGFDAQPEYDDIAEKLAGLTGIVEIQARKNTAELRENVPYQDLLFRAYRQDTKAKPHFVLPHTMTVYFQKDVRQYLTETNVTLDEEKFKKNYDNFAKRNGYTFSPTFGVYLLS